MNENSIATVLTSKRSFAADVGLHRDAVEAHDEAGDAAVDVVDDLLDAFSETRASSRRSAAAFIARAAAAIPWYRRADQRASVRAAVDLPSWKS